jgi:hypothetical protein
VLLGVAWGAAMIAFILSSAIAFALYELLAFTQWPPTRTQFRLYGSTRLSYTRRTAGVLLNILRALIVFTLLLLVLAIHNLTPTDVLARYEVNVALGFVFGPLAAVWVNSIVLRDVAEGLSAGQILSIFGLMLLFFLGATGDQTSKLIGRYANSLSSVKLAGAELSFTSKESSERAQITGAGIAGASGFAAPNVAPITGRSQGLQNLAVLDQIIERDEKYLKFLLSPKGQQIPVDDLDLADGFAKKSVSPPLTCLFAWFQNTGDPGPVDHYLTAYATGFRQLDVLNRQANAPAKPQIGDVTRKEAEQRRLKEIVSDLVRNGLMMARDVALSTTDKEVLKQCKDWFDVYKTGDEGKPAQQDNPDISSCAAECLGERLENFPSMTALGADRVSTRISDVAGKLRDFVTPFGGDSRGLESLPYFAIARASVMAQLGAHEAAATVLDDWLDQRRVLNNKPERQEQFDHQPALQIKDAWLALRVRVMLVLYVEEWLEQPASNAGNEVREEHLQNLRTLRDGFKRRLEEADFFKQLEKDCQRKCEPTFRRPAECNSDESHERLQLFRSLYSSYLTMEYTYVHRLMESPDYEDHFADEVNEEVKRLANLDLSCGAASPQPEVVYAQSLLGFAENAVNYARVRAEKDDTATQTKRLDDADRAVHFGLAIIERTAAQDQERGNKRYLERITSSFAVQTQQKLNDQLMKIRQARKSLE